MIRFLQVFGVVTLSVVFHGAALFAAIAVLRSHDEERISTAKAAVRAGLLLIVWGTGTAWVMVGN